MRIELSFDPATISQGSEGAYALRMGGLVLKFWALYKRNHATSNEFLTSLKVMQLWLDELKEEGCTYKMYTNIDEFMALLSHCGFYGTAVTGRYEEMLRWVVAHWDYFNPNINRNVILTYKTKMPVLVNYSVNEGGIRATIIEGEV